MFKWTFDLDVLAQHIVALSLAGHIPVLTVQQGSAVLRRHDDILNGDLKELNSNNVLSP